MYCVSGHQSSALAGVEFQVQLEIKDSHTSVRMRIESFAANCSLPPMQDTKTPREPTGNVAFEFCKAYSGCVVHSKTHRFMSGRQNAAHTA